MITTTGNTIRNSVTNNTEYYDKLPHTTHPYYVGVLVCGYYSNTPVSHESHSQCGGGCNG